MILGDATEGSGKGWAFGPWNSALPVAIGFADIGVDDPHHHTEMFEVYLVARGTGTAVVDGSDVPLKIGTILAVEPGEAHTFHNSTDDYLHFVVQAPFVPGDKVSG
jgi:mannose-6-phosphate isomerase-like protein (cupin superfamily)